MHGQIKALRKAKVCRMHGARGIAPEGKRNGNYRHGVRSKETTALEAHQIATLMNVRLRVKAVAALFAPQCCRWLTQIGSVDVTRT
jgi:hypothetical protein